MSSDRYLKTVLTVIAACLVYMCVMLTVWPVASAQDLNRCITIGWEGKHLPERYDTTSFQDSHPAGPLRFPWRHDNLGGTE